MIGKKKVERPKKESLHELGMMSFLSFNRVTFGFGKSITKKKINRQSK